METLDHLFSVAVESRDEAWEKRFLTLLPTAQVSVVSPEPVEGPDHWPYLLVETTAGLSQSGALRSEAAQSDQPDSVTNVVSWLSSRGIGMAVNVQKTIPDYVLTYGMIWNFRERGEFLTDAPTAVRSGRFEIKDGQRVWTGAPSEVYLPKYVRSVLKQFLMDQGVFAPKVLMVSADQVHYDLCLSIESLKSPPVQEHANIAEAVSWFLPAHYSVSLLSEKTVPGFQLL